MLIWKLFWKGILCGSLLLLKISLLPYNEISGIPPKKTNGHLCRCVCVCACAGIHITTSVHCTAPHLQMLECNVCFILPLQTSQLSNFYILPFTIMGGCRVWNTESINEVELQLSSLRGPSSDTIL